MLRLKRPIDLGNSVKNFQGRLTIGIGHINIPHFRHNPFAGPINRPLVEGRIFSTEGVIQRPRE